MPLFLPADAGGGAHGPSGRWRLLPRERERAAASFVVERGRGRHRRSVGGTRLGGCGRGAGVEGGGVTAVVESRKRCTATLRSLHGAMEQTKAVGTDAAVLDGASFTKTKQSAPDRLKIRSEYVNQPRLECVHSRWLRGFARNSGNPTRKDVGDWKRGSSDGAEKSSAHRETRGGGGPSGGRSCKPQERLGVVVYTCMNGRAGDCGCKKKEREGGKAKADESHVTHGCPKVGRGVQTVRLQSVVWAPTYGKKLNRHLAERGKGPVGSSLSLTLSSERRGQGCLCSKPRCRRRARDVEESCVFPHGGTLHKRTVAVRRPSLPQCKECVCVVLLSFCVVVVLAAKGQPVTAGTCWCGKKCATG